MMVYRKYACYSIRQERTFHAFHYSSGRNLCRSFGRKEPEGKDLLSDYGKKDMALSEARFWPAGRALSSVPTGNAFSTYLSPQLFDASLSTYNALGRGLTGSDQSHIHSWLQDCRRYVMRYSASPEGGDLGPIRHLRHPMFCVFCLFSAIPILFLYCQAFQCDSGRSVRELGGSMEAYIALSLVIELGRRPASALFSACMEDIISYSPGLSLGGSLSCVCPGLEEIPLEGPKEEDPSSLEEEGLRRACRASFVSISFGRRAIS